jgi:hypothetical protein
MRTVTISELPADGGASFIAGYASGEVAVAALGVFLVLYVLSAVTSWSWAADLAFLALVAGGLLVSWPVMILLSVAALMFAAMTGIAWKLIAPKRAAQVDAEAEAIARRALVRLTEERDKDGS